MLDYQKLSSRYAVRRLGDADTDEILALCRENTQFYAYCQAQPTKEQVQSDLRLLPPGVARADKYYLGFFQGKALIAVMDLVDGYPEKSTAFIGFFMMKKALQGQGSARRSSKRRRRISKRPGKPPSALQSTRTTRSRTIFGTRMAFKF